MASIFDFKNEQYYEILISKGSGDPSEKLGRAFVLASSMEKARRKVDEIDLIEQAKFREFRRKFLTLQDSALQLSTDAVFHKFSLGSLQERRRCFHEALLRVYLSGVENEEVLFIAYMIISITSDIIEHRLGRNE